MFYNIPCIPCFTIFRVFRHSVPPLPHSTIPRIESPAIFDQSIGRINFDYDRLSSLKFNPFLSEKEYNFSFCNDSDPDANFLSDLGMCDYYVIMLKTNLMIF